MKKTIIKFLLISSVIIGLILVLNFLFYNISSTNAGSSENVTGWAWSENIGWISFNSYNCDSDSNGLSDGTTGCPAAGTPIPNYGVNLDLISGKFSGYAWSENIGWISFNRNITNIPPSSDPCPDGSCIAKVTPSGQVGKGDVNIEGWARALVGCSAVPCTSSGPSNGWDGWIKFDHTRSNEAYIDSNNMFHNWAWGDVVGWLSLNSSEGGGGFSYSVRLRCDCSAWNYFSCGAGSCTLDKRRVTRTCDPVGCAIEEDCFPSNDCLHKECNEDDECVEVAGPGDDECNSDNDCGPKAWWQWKWWETIPKE